MTVGQWLGGGAAPGGVARPDVPAHGAAGGVHGWSAGADAVVMGTMTPSLAGALHPLSLREPVRVVEEGAAGVLALARSTWPRQDRPLVLLAADVDLELPAVLDLLDRPDVGTAALTVRADAIDAGRDAAVPVRVGPDGGAVESVGTDAHVVTDPTHALAGILRIDPLDREAAAASWQRAGQRVEVADASDAFALAVLALVRGGVPVRSVELGPFTWNCGGASSPGAPGDAWQQRLRGTSRAGDGLVAARLARPLSRRLTRVALDRRWSPDVVTALSLGAGLVAAALVTSDRWWGWVAAALLLQFGLVLGCVDGEIARFTRRATAFGAWFDSMGDRVKEYAVFAAVALVATRHGSPGWLLAVVAMALVTLRHLEDLAYVGRMRPVRRSRPDRIPLHRVRDDGTTGARTELAAPGACRAGGNHWFRKSMQLPTPERHLLISLMLLTFQPLAVLWAMVGAALVSAGWAVGGRTVRAIAGRDGLTDDLLPPSGRWSALDHQLDLGPFARALGRLMPMPAVVGLIAAGVLCIAALVAGLQHQIIVVLVVAVPALLIIGASCHPPVQDPLGWQLPGMLWLAEALVVWASAACVLPEGTRGAGYAWLAAVAYHRYDVAYRLRDTGSCGVRWQGVLALGADTRMVLVLVVAASAPDRLALLLRVGSAVLAALFLLDSGQGWREWGRRRWGLGGRRPGPATGLTG